MPESEFKKPVDSDEEIKLESALIYADWGQGAAFPGFPARVEVSTVFVGDGAKIEITGKSEDGKKLGKIKDTMKTNRFSGTLEVPEDVEPGDKVYFQVKLSANGIDDESNHIPVHPAPVVKNMKWSADEARRGETLELTADVEKVESGTEVLVTIYEHDADGAHDKITEMPAEIHDLKLQVGWEYEYHEDTDELPTAEEVERYGGTYNPPEYFFTITIGEFELGKKDQDSGLLKFKDYLELKMLDNDQEPVGGVKYKVFLPDGEERSGQLDDSGYAREDKIPPGICRVEFEDAASGSGSGSGAGSGSGGGSGSQAPAGGSGSGDGVQTPAGGSGSGSATQTPTTSPGGATQAPAGGSGGGSASQAPGGTQTPAGGTGSGSGTQAPAGGAGSVGGTQAPAGGSGTGSPSQSDTSDSSSQAPQEDGD